MLKEKALNLIDRLSIDAIITDEEADILSEAIGLPEEENEKRKD